MLSNQSEQIYTSQTNEETTENSISEETKRQNILSNLKQFIKKKTKRGRKSKHELPKKQRCDLCLEFSEYTSEPLIHCVECLALIHASCYKEKISDPQSFKCERCQIAEKEQKDIDKYHCFICNRSDGILYKSDQDEFYHDICIKFIPEMQECENKEMKTKKNIRRWRYKNSCRYCREKLSQSKAVIKCNNPRCKCYYHVPCAIQKEMIFSINFQKKFYGVGEGKSIPFFCSGHNKKLSFSYRNEIINQEGKETFSSKEETDETSCIDNNEMCLFNNILHLDFDSIIKPNTDDIDDEDKDIINNFEKIKQEANDKLLLDFEVNSINDLIY